TTPPAPEPPSKPQIAKPPKEAPRHGLPELDSKKKHAKPEKTPPPRPAPGNASTATAATAAASQTPGLSLGAAPGPGVPTGTETGGDWYLASVQQKIWTIWNQQIKSDFNSSVTVSFSILADGSVDAVRVLQSTGASLLDRAPQRAVLSAAPFAPLPRTYGTNRYTIQAVFKPVP